MIRTYAYYAFTFMRILYTHMDIHACVFVDLLRCIFVSSNVEASGLWKRGALKTGLAIRKISQLVPELLSH